VYIVTVPQHSHVFYCLLCCPISYPAHLKCLSHMLLVGHNTNFIAITWDIIDDADIPSETRVVRPWCVYYKYYYYFSVIVYKSNYSGTAVDDHFSYAITPPRPHFPNYQLYDDTYIRVIFFQEVTVLMKGFVHHLNHACSAVQASDTVRSFWAGNSPPDLQLHWRSNTTIRHRAHDWSCYRGSKGAIGREISGRKTGLINILYVILFSFSVVGTWTHFS
jgi:hypothetical protein